MTDLNGTLSKLELAQIGWVVPDILRAISFLSGAVGVTGFPPPQLVFAEHIGMSYHGKVVKSDWHTSQTYHNGIFIELVQPLRDRVCFMII